MKADLHNHSIYSDGKLSVISLYNLAVENNINLIAITDHDSVDAYKDICDNELKEKVLIGVELSTDMNGEDIHILGYFHNNDEPPLGIRNYLSSQRKRREKRICRIIRKLKDYYNLEITYDEIASFADGSIGRPHVAWAIEKKYGIPFNEVFSNYIGNNAKAYVTNEKLSTGDAIKLLKDNNALVVVAHPKQIKKNDLESIIRFGVDGVEVNYPSHDDNEKKEYVRLAKKYNLFITGGSDFHDTSISYPIGSSFISGRDLDAFINRLYK